MPNPKRYRFVKIRLVTINDIINYFINLIDKDKKWVILFHHYNLHKKLHREIYAFTFAKKIKDCRIIISTEEFENLMFYWSELGILEFIDDESNLRICWLIHPNCIAKKIIMYCCRKNRKYKRLLEALT